MRTRVWDHCANWGSCWKCWRWEAQRVSGCVPEKGSGKEPVQHGGGITAVVAMVWAAHGSQSPRQHVELPTLICASCPAHARLTLACIPTASASPHHRSGWQWGRVWQCEAMRWARQCGTPAWVRSHPGPCSTRHSGCPVPPSRPCQGALPVPQSGKCCSTRIQSKLSPHTLPCSRSVCHSNPLSSWGTMHHLPPAPPFLCCISTVLPGPPLP